MIGCITTVLLLNLSFYQFVQNKGYINKMCTHGSFFFTVVGSIGLIMLSVFDNIAHHFMHDVCVTIFMLVSFAKLGYALLTVSVWGTSSAQPWCVWIISIWALHMLYVSPCSWRVLWLNCRSLSLNSLSLSSSGSRNTPTTTRTIWRRLLNGVCISSLGTWSVVLILVVIAFVFTGYILSLIVDQLPSSQRNLLNPKGYQQLEMTTSMSLPWLDMTLYRCALQDLEHWFDWRILFKNVNIYLLVNEYQDFNFSFSAVVQSWSCKSLFFYSRKAVMAVYGCSVLKDEIIGAVQPPASPAPSSEVQLSSNLSR